jgi:hypothetical protein
VIDEDTDTAPPEPTPPPPEPEPKPAYPPLDLDRFRESDLSPDRRSLDDE